MFYGDPINYFAGENDGVTISRIELKASRLLVIQAENSCWMALFSLLGSHLYLLSYHGLLIYFSYLMYLTSVPLFSVLTPLYETRCSSTHA